MSENNNKKFLNFIQRIFRKFRPQFSVHYSIYTVLFVVIVFSIVSIVTATTPNPGHPWIEIGDGVFQVTNNQTAVRTYTFPDANATVLTTNALVTVAQGGIGIGTLASNGVLYGNGTGAVQALAVNAGASLCLTQASSAAPAWGSCGTTYTFSTGLTNTSNTITANLATGIAGGQSVIGGTASGENLTLSSTSNATKGKILFGTSAYDEVNNYLGISQTIPTAKLHITTNAIAATSTDAGGIYLENTTAATVGVPAQYSPSITLSGNGWKSNATAASQNFKWRITNEVNTGSSLVESKLQFNISQNGGAFGSSGIYMYTDRFGTSTFNSTYITALSLTGLGQLSISRTNGANASQNLVMGGTASSITSGIDFGISSSLGFAPTSGTGLFDGIKYIGTINQTGGANGISRGLYIAPTLTAAADFRAIETTQGSLIMADTYLAGSGSLAGSLVNLAQTWNTTGVPTAIKLNVTNTASTGTPLLMDLQVGGVSKFNVSAAGRIGIANTSPTEVLTLGTAGATAGTLSLAGVTSGKAIIVVSAAAGTPTLTLPTATGTLALTSQITGTNSGTNTGDVTLAGENYLSLAGQVITANAVNLSGTNVTGTLAAARFPALTGDITTSAGALATTLATVNGNLGSFTHGSFTVNAKGLITAASNGATPEVPLTFSTGLTRTSNTITSNLATGIAGGQTAIGGTAAGDILTLSSTSHATKGQIIFGSLSAYDEVNDRLGIGMTSPTAKLGVYTNVNSPTSSDTSGIILANTTAATVGVQSISPSLIFQAQGWQTATAGSQDTRFKIESLPVQGTASPTATLSWLSSINGAAYTTMMQLSSAGNFNLGATSAIFSTNVTPVNASLAAIGSSSTTTTQAEMLFGGASTISYRVAMRGITTAFPAAGTSYSGLVIGQQGATIASSGTHALFAQEVIRPLIVTTGAGILTNSATLYLEDAATNATNNYNLWAAGTGVNRFDGSVGIGTASPTGKLDLQGSAVQDGPTQGAELTTTGSGTNWTGTGFATGYTHTVGSVVALTSALAAVNGTKYQITYTITLATAGTVTITFGGVTNSAVSATGAWGPTATSTGTLSIVPTTDFDGKLVLSIKALTAASTALTNLRDSSGTVRAEMRVSNLASNNSTFFGTNAGRYITTATGSTAFGTNALQNVTTGANNTAFGINSLSVLTTGTGNVGFGGSTLDVLTTGSGNMAIGFQSLHALTTGVNNVAIGLNSLLSITTGNSNIAIGAQAGRSLTTSAGTNTFIGDSAGYNASQLVSATNSMALGNAAYTTASNQIVLGNSSVTQVTTNGILNTGLGTTASTNAVCSSLANATAPTAGTAYELRDCNAAPAADYAEMYPVAQDVTYGDIVATGTKLVDTYDTTNGVVDWTKVKGSVTELTKTTHAYQENVIGIVSDNFGDFTSAGHNIKDSDHPLPIALNGRVPVNVSPTSLPIVSGDYLTTSDNPGKAMKIVKGGMVIGKALESWTPNSGKSTVMLYVEQGFYDGQSLNQFVGGLTMTGQASAKDILTKFMADQQAGTTSLQGSELLLDRIAAGLDITTPTLTADAILANSFRPSIGTDMKVILDSTGKFIITSGVNTTNPDGTITQAPAITFDSLGNATYDGEAQFKGLTFFSNTASFTGGVSFSGQTEFMLPPLFNKDTAGFAVIKKGDKKVHVIFEKPYIAIPVVNTSVTFETADHVDDTQASLFFAQDIRSVVVDNDQAGFTILLNKTVDRDVKFSWTAFAVKNPQIFQSVVEGLIITPTVISASITPTPPIPDQPIIPVVDLNIIPIINPKEIPIVDPIVSPAPTPVITQTPSINKVQVIPAP